MSGDTDSKLIKRVVCLSIFLKIKILYLIFIYEKKTSSIDIDVSAKVHYSVIFHKDH